MGFKCWQVYQVLQLTLNPQWLNSACRVSSMTQFAFFLKKKEHWRAFVLGLEVLVVIHGCSRGSCCICAGDACPRVLCAQHTACPCGQKAAMYGRIWGPKSHWVVQGSSRIDDAVGGSTPSIHSRQTWSLSCGSWVPAIAPLPLCPARQGRKVFPLLCLPRKNRTKSLYGNISKVYECG